MTTTAYRISISRTACAAVRAALLMVFVLSPLAADAQLRVVTYNPTGSPDPGMDIVLRSIGEEATNGIAKPIDVLLLQEQSNPSPGSNSPSADSQAFATLLNNMYAGQGITYAAGTRTGSGDSTQTIVYRTETVQLVNETTIGSTSFSGQPRQAIRHLVRPVGYTSTANLFIYNSHYKASQGTDSGGTTSNADRRKAEAMAIRGSSDTLSAGSHAIYVGDHNFYDFDADEPAWGVLTAAGPGRANDPLDLDTNHHSIGTWHDNSTFASIHTQSPCISGCGSGGGVDDRFDFQLVNDAVLDSEGIDYISHSYHTFGNNGTTFNESINDPTNTYVFSGIGPMTYTNSQILNALATVTDHLPVVADYQLPAVLNAIASATPATLNVGQLFNLDLTVKNAANVLQPIGADELDYSVTTSGDLIGSFFNQTDMALGGVNIHQIQLNTSTAGMKSGLISIQTASQGAANPLITIPISFQVIASALYGDYNSDGIVDAADYTTWRDKLGSALALPNEDPSATPGSVTTADYDVWKVHFGQSLPGSGAISTVPEPSAISLLLIGICLMRRRPTRVKQG